MNDDTKRIAIGGAMKAVGEEGIVEGYAVAFTSPEERDLHGQYFSKSTDFRRDVDEIVGTPILYHHGLDSRIKRRVLGYVTKAAIDDRGVWIQAQLDMHKDYVQDVFEVAKHGALAWSSGANPMEVDVSKEGHIDTWGFIEFSETPTPAEPKKTVISAKSYRELIGDATGHEGSKAIAGEETHSTPNTLAINTPSKGLTQMKELIQKVVDMLMEALNIETPMTDEELPVVMNAVRAEADALTEEEQKALEVKEETAAKTAVIDKLALAAATSRASLKSKQRESFSDSLKRANEKMKSAPQQSMADSMGVPRAAETRISVNEERLYADMSASDMLLALKMRQASLKGFPYDPKYIFGDRTEGFMKTLAHKTVAYVADPKLKSTHANAMKAVMPWKANELNASNIVGQGLELVGEIFDTDMWLRERADPTLYDELVRKGMHVKTIPQGADRINVTTEGNDPRWNASPQAANLDVTRKPETTANFTPMGTGTVPLTAAELTCATSVTYILDEDSIINMASEVNRQINASFLEMRDQLILNGDVVRTASANINYIDGTPPSGLESPYYLAFDGIRKMALVTYTDQSRFGGALTYSDFLATINLLPYAVRSRVRNIVMVVSPDVETWGLSLPENTTRDVRGDEFTNATGRLPLTYGQMPITSDFIPQTGVAGKEYQLTANLGNNVYGTIAVVYAPYLAFGNKRQITIESERNMYAGTIDWVARVRMGMVARGADGVGVTYGLSQS